MNTPAMQTPRLVLLHKQSTSGRTRFLRMPAGVVLFSPLPAQARLLEEDDQVVVPHPAAAIADAETRLGLPNGSIEALAEFAAWVETADGQIPVLLGAFTTIDPPFEQAGAVDGKFIAITEARSLSEIERLILRLAYEHVLG